MHLDLPPQLSTKEAPTGIFKKMSDTAFLGKLMKDHKEKTEVTTEKTMLRSHNDYVMQLTAANVQRRK
jgi:hypothetical protein